MSEILSKEISEALTSLSEGTVANDALNHFDSRNAEKEFGLKREFTRAAKYTLEIDLNEGQNRLWHRFITLNYVDPPYHISSMTPLSPFLFTPDQDYENCPNYDTVNQSQLLVQVAYAEKTYLGALKPRRMPYRNEDRTGIIFAGGISRKYGDISDYDLPFCYSLTTPPDSTLLKLEDGIMHVHPGALRRLVAIDGRNLAVRAALSEIQKHDLDTAIFESNIAIPQELATTTGKIQTPEWLSEAFETAKQTKRTFGLPQKPDRFSELVDMYFDSLYFAGHPITYLPDHARVSRDGIRRSMDSDTWINRLARLENEYQAIMNLRISPEVRTAKILNLLEQISWVKFV